MYMYAAAKSLQSCPTLCDPIDGSPPGSPVPGILQARTLEWVAISFSSAWKWKVEVTQLSLTLHDPMDCSLPGSSFRSDTTEWLNWTELNTSRHSTTEYRLFVLHIWYNANLGPSIIFFQWLWVNKGSTAFVGEWLLPSFPETSTKPSLVCNNKDMLI